MPAFSANLGFLFTEYPLPGAIRAAHRAGFDAVECHWPYETDPAAVREALAETGLVMLGLNSARGDVEAGEFGLSALPGRDAQARAAIDAAFDYAEAIDAQAVHVLAGKAPEGDARAEAAFRTALGHACDRAEAGGRTVLIEPLNGRTVPGYFLQRTDHAASIIADSGRDCLKLMFDCFQVQMTEGDLTHRLTTLLPLIGHIQFAGVPLRGGPETGEVNYHHLFAHIDALGWRRPLGAEYVPDGPTEASLDWLHAIKAQERSQS